MTINTPIPKMSSPVDLDEDNHLEELDEFFGERTPGSHVIPEDQDIERHFETTEEIIADVLKQVQSKIKHPALSELQIAFGYDHPEGYTNWVNIVYVVK